jgi:hypothetical protein
LLAGNEKGGEAEKSTADVKVFFEKLILLLANVAARF